MPTNAAFDNEKYKEHKELGGVKKKTKEDRQRHFGYLFDFLKKNLGDLKVPSDLKNLLATQEGKKTFSQLLDAYFFTLRVNNDEERWPKLGYAENLRSSIKNFILAEYNIDIQNLENFPTADYDWKCFVKKLTMEGKATTDHKEEVPPMTVDSVYMLLTHAMNALQNRGDENYVEKYLAPLDVKLHYELHRILMYGACFVLLLYEARRAGQNLDIFLLTDFKEVQDETWEFRYIKKYRSEQDKNHGTRGTNVACSGVIPFTDTILMDGKTVFNPGELFAYYLSKVPPEATTPSGKGGFLFMAPRRKSKKFDLHDPANVFLYEPNMKGGTWYFLNL